MSVTNEGLRLLEKSDEKKSDDEDASSVKKPKIQLQIAPWAKTNGTQEEFQEVPIYFNHQGVLTACKAHRNFEYPRNVFIFVFLG